MIDVRMRVLYMHRERLQQASSLCQELFLHTYKHAYMNTGYWSTHSTRHKCAYIHAYIQPHVSRHNFGHIHMHVQTYVYAYIQAAASLMPPAMCAVFRILDPDEHESEDIDASNRDREKVCMRACVHASIQSCFVDLIVCK